MNLTDTFRRLFGRTTPAPAVVANDKPQAAQAATNARADVCTGACRSVSVCGQTAEDSGRSTR